MSDTDSMSEQFEDTQELLLQDLDDLRGSIASFHSLVIDGRLEDFHQSLIASSSSWPPAPSTDEEAGVRIGMPTPQYSPTYTDPMTSRSTQRSNVQSKLLLPSQLSFHVGNDPITHVDEFLTMVAPLLLDDEALIEIFSCYLFGRADIWFHQQCGGKFHSFYDLTTRFIDHFLTSAGLPEITPQWPNESFWSFVGRWNDALAEIRNLPTENDQTRIILSRLNFEYKTMMASRSCTTLGELMLVGLGIDRTNRGYIRGQAGPSTATRVSPQHKSTRPS